MTTPNRDEKTMFDDDPFIRDFNRSVNKAQNRMLLVGVAIVIVHLAHVVAAIYCLVAIVHHFT